MSQQCLQAPTLGDFADKAGELAKSLGADQKCSQSAHIHSNTFSASASGSMLFASAGGQTSTSSMDNKMNEDGCSSIAMQMSQVFTGQNNINCQIKNSTVNTSISLNASSKINITNASNHTPEELESRNRQIHALNTANKNLETTYDNLLPTLTYDQEHRLSQHISQITRANNDLIAKLNKAPEITLKNSKFISESNVNFASSITLNDQTLSNIKANAQSVVSSSAEAKVKNKFGLAALSPNSKNAISEITKNVTNNIDQTIQNIVNKTSANYDASTGVNIISQGDIYMENVTIQAKSVADITMQSVTTAVSDISDVVVNNFITKHLSKSDVANQVAGSDDLQRAMGDTIGEAIKAAKVDSLSSMIGFVLIGLICLVALYFVYKTGASPIKAISAVENPKVKMAIAVVALIILIVGIVVFKHKGIKNKIAGVILMLISIGMFSMLLYTFSA